MHARTLSHAHARAYTDTHTHTAQSNLGRLSCLLLTGLKAGAIEAVPKYTEVALS